MTSKHSCPLCFSKNTPFYSTHQINKQEQRDFYQCDECSLLFTPPQYHLEFDAEKHRYQLHNNDIEDTGYQDFLNRLLDPLRKRIQSGMEGLDYGCGPSLTAEILLKDEGVQLHSYDPYFYNRPELLNRTWDFIVLSEVAEHFYYPEKDWKQLFSMLRPGGILGVMTTCYPGKDRFQKWRYKDDETHTVFYSEKTFRWIAKRFQAEWIEESATVSFFILK